jgi:cysteine peptidase C11 family protein
MAEIVTPQRKKPWTVMVFMAADATLEPYADIDISEMEAVGSGRKLNVVVQIDRGVADPERFLVRRKKSLSCGTVARETLRRRAGETNTGNPRVLDDFLKWSQTMFPADHYLLVLWGHFVGLGFARDGDDALLMTELASVVADFKGRNNGKNLDIIGGDTCRMSFAEAAFELRKSVDFMVVSEVGTKFQGWPYTAILGEIASHRGAIPPAKLGRSIVNHYIESFEPPSVALTMLNLQRADDLGTALKNVIAAVAAAAAGDRNGSEMNRILKAFDDAEHGKVRALIDLYDLCANLKDGSRNAAVRKAAGDAIDVLRHSADGLVAFRRRRGSDARKLHGLGVFAPLVTERGDWYTQRIRRENYKSMSLADETGWGELVYGLYDERVAAARAREGNR